MNVRKANRNDRTTVQKVSGLERRSSANRTSDRRALVMLLVILAFSLAVRWPMRSIPLVRDEAEYAQLGQQILAGAVPYRDIYNQKTPFAFYFMAAVQWLAPTSVSAIRVATILYGLVVQVVTFAVARRLLGTAAALWAALALGVMTFNMCGTSHASSTEMYLLLWMAAAVWFWYADDGSRSKWTALSAGVCAAMAYQTKQTGIAVLAFLVAEGMWQSLRTCWLRRSGGAPGANAIAQQETRASRFGETLSAEGLRVLAVVSGFVAMTAAIVFWFIVQGGFDAYIECTWTNNFQYVGRRHEVWTRTFELLRAVVLQVIGWDLPLWLVGAVALVVLAARPRIAGRASGLWLLLATTGAMAMVAGHPYKHYFEPLTLPLALGVGCAMAWIGRHVRPTTLGWPRAAVWITAGALVWLGPLMLHVRAVSSPQRAIDELAELGPFVDAEVIGRYLKEKTSPSQRFLIVGSEPEIYFHAERGAATRMVITYPLCGPYRYAPELRQQFLDDLAKKPPYVVLSREVGSITEWPDLLPLVLEPVNEILRRDYQLEAGLAHGEVVPRSDQRIGESRMLIFRRRGA